MTDSERLAALKTAVEKVGFEVLEGQFYLTDGTTSPYYLRPVDAVLLAAASARARFSGAGGHP